MLRIRLWQIGVVAAICAGAIVFAVPNLFGRASLESYPSWLPSSQVNLGLDLQGGSHLLLEVQVADILRERITALVDDTRVALRRAGIKYTGLKAARDRVVFQLINPSRSTRPRTRSPPSIPKPRSRAMPPARFRSS